MRSKAHHESDVKEYTPELEDLFVRFLISDATLLTRCLSIIDPDYFEHRPAKTAIKFLIKYVNDHSTIPSTSILNTTAKVNYELIDPSECKRHEDWFLGEFELFCRHRGLEIEILNSADLLEQKRYGEVEARIRAAVQVGLVKDLGTDAFDNPQEQIKRLLEKGDMVPTLWRDLDTKLYGGTERGTLTIFAGQSGSGKSLFLQNWALNLVQQGMNVVYITLELSEKLTNLRLYAMISGYGTRELFKNTEDTAMRVAQFAKKNGGSLQIKQMPNGSTANDIRAYLKEYEIQTGLSIHAVMVDYLDLLMPHQVKVSPSDMFVKDKYVSEELRNLAIDVNAVLGTASQLNRQSHDELEFDHSHISGGISKINTADNVIAIFTTNTMKENGRYQIQLLKTRSSSGTGAKINLKYNMKTMRIDDLEESEASTETLVSNDMVEQLKKKSILRPAKERPDDKQVIEEGTKLRDYLRRK